MNKIEKVVYDALKQYPKLKERVRNIYQLLFDLLPNKRNYFLKSVSVRNGYFFGFHDQSPFSLDDTKVLANRLTIPLRMPTKCDVLEVGYFSCSDCRLTSYQKIGETKAWNYHKGCRLQWAGNDQIIYNDVSEGKLVARIYHLRDKTTKLLSYPIDSVSVCGNYAVTFSYGRLEMAMPGYGYVYDDDSYKDEKITENTGLFVSDLGVDRAELIVSLLDLHEKGGLKRFSVENAHQYVTHSLFSSDGRYISFLHRATNISDVMKRWSQLVVYDRETKALYFSPTDELVSHYVWNKKNQILAYCRIDNIDSHVLFESPDMGVYKRVAYPLINSDGHQSFISDTKFVTDTYPDKYRMANLYAVDIEDDTPTLIATINSLKRYQSRTLKHWCCDLHPRMNHSGTMVCFDSVHTGERALCIMRL